MPSLFKKSFFVWLILIAACIGADDLPINLEYSDFFEIVRGLRKDTIYITGSTRFSHSGGKLFADSAIWIKGETIVLKGNVLIEDSLYQLSADRVDYNILSRTAYASGDEVIIISEEDSIKAVGTNAYFSRDSSLFRMNGRPMLTLNYPDSNNLINITADFIAFESESEIGYADGNVKIIQMDTEAESERAIMYSNRNILLLLGSAIAKRGESEIVGDTLIFFSDENELKRLFAQGNAEGHLKEPSKDDSTLYNLSDLKAKEIEFNFIDGQLDNVKGAGQAYSYYNPAILDSSNIEINHISGDSISLFLKSEELSSIKVIGGAEGEYLMGEYKNSDSGQYYIEDTVSYASDSIFYLPEDSTISLISNASVNDAKVSLKAATINYNTSDQVVTAYDDTTKINDTTEIYVPVLLKDGTEELLGSYLEYSMETEKGMIWHSKSEFQDAYYRGKELFREKENLFYVKNGIYTSCDADPPHFHFWSYKMKIIKDERAMARPVMLFIEKIPFPPIPFPYYIFPLKKGRHSGILPFKFGNFSRGGRFIKNVGYYWAASEYWDALASFDYNEEYGTTFNGALKYNLRYHLSGSISGSYINESHFSGFNEVKGKRWSLRFNHSQTISPTFNIRANGHFISDKSYYTDYSTNQDDRLNRSLNSQLSFSKRFGNVSLSGQFKHTDEIDKETRTDWLPTASISFPSGAIFGTPPKDSDGKSLKKWYHGIYSRYSVSFRNYSRRTTATVITDADTSNTGTVTVLDSARVKSRREYMTINHRTGVSAPFRIFSYFKLNPSVNYTETWIKIFQTDQSDLQNINSSAGYRRYLYSAGVNASTDLYGTIKPKLFMLEGLRHVLTPSIGFSWAPELKRHEKEMAYAGAGGGSTKKKSMSFSLRQIFQAKLKSGEDSKKIDLFTVNSSASYNFEATGKKFSNLSTNAQATILKKINISATWRHDLYKQGTEELRWWSPYLLSFSLSTTFRTGGILGEYEQLSDGSENFPAKSIGQGNLKQGWNFSLTHHYNESGRGQSFRKTHTASFGLNVNLTPNLNIDYRQYYNFVNAKTISRSLTVVRKLHCWEGRFSWVIDGAYSGFQFRLNVISIPEIKYEKSESGIRDSFF